MTEGIRNKVWDQFIRFERSTEETYEEIKINKDNGTNLFEVRCHGADAELILVGQGEGGEDKLELTVKLDSISNQPEGYGLPIANNENPDINVIPFENNIKATSFINPNPPNSKYRTTTVHFTNEKAPTVKLYCINNYNWELHLNDSLQHVYQIYRFNLMVGGYTSDCSIALLENQVWKPICKFRKRFFSISSARVEFKNEVTTPTLKLLMTVMAYFRYSHYGKDVTISGTDPNVFNSVQYSKNLVQRREQRERRERLERERFSTRCYNPSHNGNNLESLCTHLHYDKNIISHCCNSSHRSSNKFSK